MKHCIFILLFSIGVVINCYSQASHSLHIGPHLGIPSNNLGNASLGFGGSVEYNLKFRGPIGGQFHLGYSRFSNKSISDQEVTFFANQNRCHCIYLRRNFFYKCRCRYFTLLFEIYRYEAKWFYTRYWDRV